MNVKSVVKAMEACGAAFNRVNHVALEVQLGVQSNANLISALKTWEKTLQDLGEGDRLVFARMTLGLFAVHEALKDLAKTDPMVRSYMDRIFPKRGLLQDQWRSAPNPATLVFDEFIKGITFFADQVDAVSMYARPLYHRFYSCGPGSPSLRTNHSQCRDSGMGVKERQEVKARTERCYIERLLYDRLYTEMPLHDPVGSPGNVPRSQFLRESTERDFNTCFPNIRIMVTLKYHQYGWPDECRITRLRMGRAGGMHATSTEVYKRHIDVLGGAPAYRYTDMVECTRLTEGGKEHRKAQSFIMGQQPWKLKIKHEPALKLDWNAWHSMNADTGSRHAAAVIENTFAPHWSRPNP